MGEESRMRKVIFFTEFENFHKALDQFDVKSFTGKKVPVKIHMGEIRNKYFPKPEFVRIVIDELKKVHVDPYLFDTTVAYSGLRNSKTGYQKLAKINGFTVKKIGCNVMWL